MAFAMWSSLLPTLLVLIFCVASVSADCYNDSAKTYNNCDTCYRTLVNAVLNTDNNKYNISTTMFPLDYVPPIYVEVYYVNTDDCETIKSTDIKTSCESNPNCQLWYWTAGTFYVYQPLDVFYYRSLFFSDPSWRTGTLSVCIPTDCDAPEEFYKTLTQRMKAYAMFLTDAPQLDNTFIGKAVTGNRTVDYENDPVYGRVRGVSIKHALRSYHIVPFFFVFIILAFFYICVMYALCYEPCSKPCKRCASWRSYGAEREVSIRLVQMHPEHVPAEHVPMHTEPVPTEPEPTRPVPSNSALLQIYNVIEVLLEDGLIRRIIKPIKKHPQKQANVVSVVAVCTMLSFYITALDIASLIIEKNSDLPKYYDMHDDIFNYTAVFASISIMVLIAGFVMPVVWWLCCSYCCKDACKKDQKAIYIPYFVIPIYLIVSSTLLSLTFHFQNVLLAWVTNPLYASRIALFYGIIIFLDFLVFKYVYTIPLAFASLLNLGSKGTRVVAFLGVICVILSGFVLIGLQAMIVVLLIYIPINNSLEESANGISVIYNSVFLLFGGIIAYNVGGLYFRRIFSIEKAVKKAMKAMINTPFDGNDIERAEEWKGYTEQKKLKEIIKALLQRETRKGPMYLMVPQPEGQGASNSPNSRPAELDV